MYMPPKICPSNTNYFMCKCETTMSLHIPHMTLLQWKMWPGALVYIHSTLLAYAPTQIYLPHCTYNSHCTSTIVYIYIPHYCTHQSKIKNQKCTAKYVIVNTRHLKCHKHATCQNHALITWWAFMEKHANIHATYEVSSINYVARITVHRWLWQR